MEQWFIDAKWSGEGKVTITAKPWVPTLNFNMYRSGRVKKFMNISRTFPSDKLKSWFLVKVSLTGQEKKSFQQWQKVGNLFFCLFFTPRHIQKPEEEEREIQRQRNLEPSQLIYSNIQKQFQVFLHLLFSGRI